MNFEETTNRYWALREQLRAGQISSKQFEEMASELRVQTADGVWWQVRAADGVWMRWNGATWEATNQFVAPPKTFANAATAPSTKKRKTSRSCLKIVGVGLLSIICIVLVLGVGGYYLFSTGQITAMQILSRIGPGAGEIQIINVSDDVLDVRLVQLDTESGSPETIDSFTLDMLLINGFGAVEAGHYQLEINVPSGIPNGGVCNLRIRRDDFYQFIAVPEGIVITLNEQIPEDLTMLTISQSPLCQQ